ncbi:MAG: hypothetical protein AAFO82_02635, partial [Bacteroidota bacterium]
MSALALTLIQKEKKERTGKLDLGYCGLRELPEELFECTWLEELYLCNAYYDYEKREWIHSKNEGETYNKFSKLPEQIASLTNLKVLYVNGGANKYGNLVIYDISDFSILKGLTQLHTLDLRYNS